MAKRIPEILVNYRRLSEINFVLAVKAALAAKVAENVLLPLPSVVAKVEPR